MLFRNSEKDVIHKGYEMFFINCHMRNKIKLICLPFILSLFVLAGNGVAAEFSPEYIENIQNQAEQGNAEAQRRLGFMYEKGRGVTQNSSKAVEWYQKAADQGNAAAQYNLGFMYQNGKGVLQDYTKAAELYQKAADQGDDFAQYSLGVMYANGQGVTQSDSKAVEWYQKSADQGYAGAQNNLAFMYNKGRGVTQNNSKAVELYQKAADQGNAAAQFNLGAMYEKGESVSQDYTKAAELYKKSADKGNAFAQYSLGVMYEKGRGVTQSNSKAVEWYQKSAEQGYAGAQNKLAIIHGNGRGVTQNSSKAAELHQKTAANGNVDARDKVKSFPGAAPNILTRTLDALPQFMRERLKPDLTELFHWDWKISIAALTLLTALALLRMSSVFILSLPIWYFYPQLFIPFMVVAFLVALVRSIMSMVRYKKHGPSLFALSYAENQEYHTTGRYITSAVSEFKKADQDAKRAGISKNRDGSYNRRSAAGKKVHASLDKCSEVERKYLSRHNALSALPTKRWERIVCSPFSFLVAPIILSVAWHYIAFELGHLLVACFAMWALYWIVNMTTDRFIRKFIPKP